MNVQIQESGVTFGDFDRNDLFLIEQVIADAQLTNMGVKSVEFVWRHSTAGKQMISLVEAKSSIPRDTDNFFNDIRQKMQHALALWFCTVAGRHEKLKHALPEHQRNLKNLQLPLRLVLVIPKAPDAILPQLTDLFRQKLRTDRAIWAIDHSAVVVLNAQRAMGCGLIKAEI